ncbi:hypothetical protein GCM10011340_30710 [Roseivirga thermotolerans]|uniref:Lipoprotein n=1 Tax=Roseivirga thermotolerans TaxID=1758176 RepID=A0ABQ3I8X8_9BACT|nr:hypothetical protein GCM10011340_30710 [Roseivirga thermotolerans]
MKKVKILLFGSLFFCLLGCYSEKRAREKKAETMRERVEEYLNKVDTLKTEKRDSLEIDFRY